jgi:hypothetical protein
MEMTDDQRRDWFASLSWPERCVYDRAYSVQWAKNGQQDAGADRVAQAAVEKKRKEK